MVRTAFIATLLVGAMAVPPVSAQSPPTPPDHYALTNARIVTAPGRVIPNGTVVVRDGRITAVGPQVAIPAAAIRLDLNGLTVYPGLIDPMTTVGMPAVQAGGGRGAGGGGVALPGQPGAAPPPRQEVAPERNAADVYEPTEAVLAEVRNAGFTTVGVGFQSGIFPGRVAAVNTGGTRNAVLRTPIAQQVMLGRRQGGYPGTLMGAIAFVKQSFLDSRHETRVRTAWERSPSGPRPEYRAELRGLELAASGAIPVWFDASTQREIDRIITIAAELGVRDYVIVGAQEGWLAIDDLKRAARPVIASLAFPNPGSITGRAFELNVAPVSGRNEAAIQADSAAARAARGNAAALARAGITFALSGEGVPAAQLRDRVRAAIEAGLSADDALRALTITPARLLGLEAALGTIEVGKIANLVVSQGDLFARDARIRHVFVDGVRYDVPAPAPAGRQGGPGGQNSQGNRGAEPPAGAAGVVGDWTAEFDGPAGHVEGVLTITAGEGNALTGRLTSDMGNVALTGEMSGNDFILRGTLSPPNMNALSISLTGRRAGEDLRCTFTPQGLAGISFVARRVPRGTPGMEDVR